MVDKSASNGDQGSMNCCTCLCSFFKIYWKSLIVVLWPIALSPLLIFYRELAYRCLYVVALMGLYWVTEAIPLAVTGMIPIVLYPLLGIMDTGDTCVTYFSDTTLMFITSLMIAVAIEHSGLHMRVALIIIRTVGCSHRKLTFGLFFVTMVISMWISNTAATAMMIPIVEKVLGELEAQGLGKIFIENNNVPPGDSESKRPTKLTLTYYFGAAFASSIGGIGTLVGSGTNLTTKGIYETRFPNSPGINFAAWMLYATPVMLALGLLIWLWLQVLYMGMFRPKSKEAKDANIGEDGERIAASVLKQRYKELGPISWHESAVGILFIVVVFLWFFRKPDFIPGWAEYVTNLKVKDSTAACAVTILMFMIPARLDFLKAFSKDPAKRPTTPSPGLVTWSIINQKMHWSLVFILGGGFAIAAGSKSSGLSKMLADSLNGLQSLDPLLILIIICFFAETLTELTSNVAVATIILPVLSEMCIALRIHPLYLMVPVTMACSFSFHLPVGTPPNAIVSAAGKIRTKDFIICGIGPSIITGIILPLTFNTWGVYAFDLHEFPSWAV